MIQSANAKIMVLASDPHFSYLMQRYVKTSSYQVIFPDLCDDIAALVRREKPVAIVLEASLPDNMGWDTLRALKTDAATTSTPVLFCSWLDDKDRSLSEGADAYLRMPILYEDFGAALSRVGIGPNA